MNLSISSAVTQDISIQSRSSLNAFKQPFRQDPLIVSNNYNDYSNNYIHSIEKPIKFIRNIENPLIGYPKLNKLIELKSKAIKTFKIKPFGKTLQINQMLPFLNKLVNYQLKFDIIIIGSITENQFIMPFLINLPLSKLCSKPGFLFIWASSSQINELSSLLNNSTYSNWSNFRKSEELVFIPVNNKILNSNNDSLFDNNQYHCWMCITGTVRRSIDNHLIHCNIDTDLKIEDEKDSSNNSIPEFIYKIAENFSSGNKRLHILPSKTGYKNYVKPRDGWFIISPDIMLDNFTVNEYQDEINKVGSNVKYDDEIEKLRPKSPKKFSK